MRPEFTLKKKQIKQACGCSYAAWNCAIQFVVIRSPNLCNFNEKKDTHTTTEKGENIVEGRFPVNLLYSKYLEVIKKIIVEELHGS